MLPAATDLILVCVLPKPRDREIARLFGWYRIPLRRAPKLLEVDYLAFYQPRAFGGESGRIAYAAPVIGHELTTRAQLLNEERDHPRAREEYFKLQLGPLVRLPRPVVAQTWRRFAFFYTTGLHLLGAGTLEDLVVRGEERTLLWKALRDRVISQENYRAPEWPEIPNRELLAALLDPHQGPER